MLTANDRTEPENALHCSLWTAEHVALIASNNLPETAIIDADQAQAIVPHLTLWDIWPVQYDDGSVAQVAGGSLWMILSAPRRDDPNQRHDEARIRLLHQIDGQWRDCGNLLPDGFAPGSREWSGSARLDPQSNIVTLWFTAAGRNGAVKHDFEQRLFHATGSLSLSGAHPAVTNWQGLAQSVINDGSHYADLAVNQGVPGHIKGFRDPYWFRDPADGKGYILFTGSKSAAVSLSDFDGVIGIAASADNDGCGAVPYILLPAIVDGDGVANEMERPHVFVHGGLYYLFWSSQAQIFSPDVTPCPTGLYGMVAPSLFGPYEPLNSSGLVLANPAIEPRQAYAWQVLPSLDIVSFVDYWGMHGREEGEASSQFGGTIAPIIKIELNGSATRIVGGAP